MELLRLHQRSLKTRVTVATLLIFVLSLWALSFFASLMLRKDMVRLLGEQQYSTVSILAADIDRELKFRIETLGKVAALSTTTMAESNAASQRLIELNPALEMLFNGGVVVTDVNGLAIADLPLPAKRIGVNFMNVDVVAAAIREGKSSISRPVPGITQKSPVLGIAAPIRNAQQQIIGSISGVTNLAHPNFLDAVAQSRYGKTGGYLLVAPQYRLVVTATDKSRVLEELPAPGVSPMIDRFIDGHEGSAVLVNPQGIEVLASAKGIAAAGWYAVTVLPTSEAFAPIRDMQKRMLLTTIILTILAGYLTRWILRRQLEPLLSTAKVLATLPDSEQYPAALPITRQDEIGRLIGGFNRLLEALGKREAALQSSEESLAITLHSIGDAVIATDTAGNVRRMNPTAERLTGWTLADALGRPLDEVFRIVNADTRETVTNPVQLVMARGQVVGLANHTVLLARDGQEFQIADSAAPIRDAAGGIVGVVLVFSNVTEQYRVERALQQEQQFSKLVIDNLPGIFYLYTYPDCRLVLWNKQHETLLGFTAEEMKGRHVADWHVPEAREALLQVIDQLMAEGQLGREALLVTKTGQRVPYYLSGIRFEAQNQLYFLGIGIDISERKQAEERLHLAASVFSHAREGILIATADGKIIDVNDAFTRITGYSRDEALGQNPRLLSSGRHGRGFYASFWRDLIAKGHWYGELWNRRKNGEVIATMQAISAVRDEQGVVQRYVSLFSDITALKEHQKQLEHMAHYDVLTTLPNRVLLADRLHQAMVQTQRRGHLLAVAYIDLDGFKAVNDKHGHKAGDQLLIALADHMKQTLREGDTLARLGGDEFVAVLLDLDDVAASVPMLSRLLAAAAQPMAIGDYIHQVSASLGVTFYPQTEEVDADQLLRQSDQAMYQAKLAGKNRYHVFDADQDRSVRGHHESLQGIRRALTAHEFVLHYQPKVNMRTGTVIGAEALIRWQHPQRGLLQPAVFLPAIEDHPLAVELGEWIIETALTQIESWQRFGLDIPVSVNVGAQQLLHGNFAVALCAILERHPDMKPGFLEIEVLETSALEDLARVSQIIEDCRDLGVTFSLDDFGTGYSSLTYLKRLSVTQLKIDQSFVRDMLDDPDDLAILGGVLSLATAFRRQVIAEGVETVEHGTMLLQLGCELAQGYGIARPMPASEIPGWVAAWQPEREWSRQPAVNRDDLPLLFASVEHRAWIVAFEDFLRGNRETLPLVHHQCSFNSWLNSENQSRHAGQSAFLAIGPLHRDLHALAAELLDQHTGGQTAAALARLAELNALRDALLAQLQALIQNGRK